LNSDTNENSHTNSDKEIFDEYYNSIKESYKTKSSKFNQVLLIWMGFTFVFFLLILFPYYSIQTKNYEATNLLNAVTKEIDSLQEQIKPYQTAKEGIGKLKQDINNFPAVLREYIDSFNDGSFSAIQQGPTVKTFSNCDQITNQTFFIRCNVIEQAKELFVNYNTTLFEQVIASLIKIDKNIQNIMDIPSLKIKTNNLQNSFNDILKNTPELSEFYPSKLGVRDQLQTEVDKYWNEYYPLIEVQIQKIEPDIHKLIYEKNNLTSQLNLLNDTKQQIEKRIDQIEFPFGKLPIGINDSIYLFPIGIAVGFILIVSIMSDQFKLRQDLFQFYEKKDRNKRYYTNFNFSKIFPIWIDQLNSSIFIKSMKFLLLLLPFIVFLISWYMIDNIWTIDNTNNIDNIIFGDKTLNRYVYQISYLIILGLFIYGYSKIIYEYKKYNKISISNKNINE